MWEPETDSTLSTSIGGISPPDSWASEELKSMAACLRGPLGGSSNATASAAFDQENPARRMSRPWLCASEPPTPSPLRLPVCTPQNGAQCCCDHPSLALMRIFLMASHAGKRSPVSSALAIRAATRLTTSAVNRGSSLAAGVAAIANSQCVFIRARTHTHQTAANTS